MNLSTKAIIVDDIEKELFDIHNKLGLEIKIPTIPLLYSTDGENEKLSPGVRLCFLDVQLLEGHAIDSPNQFSAICSFLSSILAENNGPYIVIAWTKDPHVFDQYKAFITDRKRMGTCPIPIDVGCVDKANVEESSNIINMVIDRNPEFKALLEWESSVNKSSALTIDSLYSVSNKTSINIKDILKGLGHSSIGHSNLAANVFIGINEALLPILKDYQTNFIDTSTIWDTLFDHPETPISDKTKKILAPIINSHLLYERRTGICKKTPGAIIDIEYNTLKVIYSELPENILDFAKKLIKSYKNTLPLVLSSVLVEISPCCDFAQNKVPRSKYMIGVKVSGDIHPDYELKCNGDSTYMSRIVTLQEENTPSFFMFSSNYTFTLNHTEIPGEATCNYRMREQLFIELQKHYSNHVTRSGLITL